MQEDPSGRSVTGLRGRVVRRTVGGGSKSEREALVLEASGRDARAARAARALVR